MEYLYYVVLAIFVFFLLRGFLPTKGVNNISTTELKTELKNKDKQFIDVRTPGEFKGNHIKGFKNIPLNQLAHKAASDISKEQEVLVICQSGMRSKQASKLLKKYGCAKVTNVRGGMNAWQN
ncbi:rhodanese-like domain-containing protein [Gracilibacillus oryzae]|uniref:Rhodanese-like domain-containing protein n=1 Tax=Gracilibacillus oryzae TaxID=1672701 RepID=A0A7C8GRX9_9BACI|nr:rhodanese-like domain-containing protein [Gracilibacillus oryzae]KAB8128984.1 rhodanese-like domain-containing protein [Gracilibacillus oryzae]